MEDEEPAERVLRKIESIMQERHINQLIFERQYLPETFFAELLEIYVGDGLPKLKVSTLKYFMTRGIITKYQGNVIKFSKFLLPDVEALAIVSKDGLPLASTFRQAVDERKIAAMSATILNISEKTMQEFAQGDLERILIKYHNGNLILLKAGENAILAVLCAKNASLGMVFLHIEIISREIAEFLEKNLIDNLIQ